MDARTAVKARLLDLTTSVLELVRDGNRDAEEVCQVFQTIKDSSSFFGQLFTPPVQAVDVSLRLESWRTFYHQFFGLDLDFSSSSVPIPSHQPGFDRLIIVAQGLTPNQVYKACQQHFKCSCYTDDLDASLDWDQEERDPRKAAYAVWVRDVQEADEELKGLSANQIKERGLTTETLTERLLHGLIFWSETKRHLDTDNITYCSGSRDRDGYVPRVGWDGHDGEVSVGDDYPDDSCDYLRARAVVS